jgi:hypothetical protein
MACGPAAVTAISPSGQLAFNRLRAYIGRCN